MSKSTQTMTRQTSMPSMELPVPGPSKTDSLIQMYKAEKVKKVSTKSKGKCCKTKKATSKLNNSTEKINLEHPERGEPKNAEEKIGQIENTVTDAGDEVIFRNLADFEPLQEMSTLLKDLENSKEKVFLTKKEKRCLEEITNLTSKIRVPLDDRQMHYFNKDVDRFATAVTLPEAQATEEELNEAAVTVKETPSKVMATELNTLATYLNGLKDLIAKREITWASTTDNDYAQKVEISRLKNEVTHLRVVLTKRQSEITDKNRIIEEKEKEITRLQRVVQKLKKGIIELEKNYTQQESVEETTKPRSTPNPRPAKSSNVKLMEELLLNEMGKTQRGAGGSGKTGPMEEKVMKIPGAEARKNQGPAALLANALYKARNAGNFVNF